MAWRHSLDRFAAECEAVGMRISTSKSEAMVLSRNPSDGCIEGMRVDAVWCNMMSVQGKSRLLPNAMFIVGVLLG